MKGQVVEPGRIVPQVQERPGGRRDRAIDREIAELAERQHGVVALPQLEGLALRAHGRRMAAVLAVGPDAVPSHRTAEVLGRTSPTRGTKLLCAVLEEPSGHTVTASGLEEAFVAICRRAGVPVPR